MTIISHHIIIIISPCSMVKSAWKITATSLRLIHFLLTSLDLLKGPLKKQEISPIDSPNADFPIGKIKKSSSANLRKGWKNGNLSTWKLWKSMGRCGIWPGKRRGKWRMKDTWWLMPRILSGWVHPSWKWIKTLLLPVKKWAELTPTYAIRGMKHQVSSDLYPFHAQGLVASCGAAGISDPRSPPCLHRCPVRLSFGMECLIIYACG